MQHAKFALFYIDAAQGLPAWVCISAQRCNPAQRCALSHSGRLEPRCHRAAGHRMDIPPAGWCQCAWSWAPGGLMKTLNQGLKMPAHQGKPSLPAVHQNQDHCWQQLAWLAIRPRVRSSFQPFNHRHNNSCVVCIAGRTVFSSRRNTCYPEVPKARCVGRMDGVPRNG